MNKMQITQEGLENLKIELTELIDIKRPDLLVRLQRARSMGDLRENSEYSAAKEEQGMIEGRILELQQIIENAEIVKGTGSGNIVALGTTVIVEVNGKQETYHIVGDFEADPMNRKLSQSSPIGKALVGKKIGEMVNIEVPSGTILYKIIEIKHL